MAPRKRTTTEKQDVEVNAAPTPEPSPNPQPAPKKAPKVAAKTPKTAAKKALPPEPMAAAVEPSSAPKAAAKAGSNRKKPAEPTVAEAPAEPIAAPVPSEGFTPHARAIMEAISAGKAVEFLFKDADTNPPRTFEARQLIFDVFTGAWFAWGWDRRYNAERHHRLDLLAEINLVDGPGRAAQGPFAEGTPANQIGGWRGGDPIPVKAVLQKQWIFAVKQSPAPFPDFKIEDIEDGKAQVSFTATDLRAIARWCMQFGDGIQVQEPQRLVDRIKQVGIAWTGKAPAAPAPPAKPQPRHEPKHEPKHESKPEPRPESRPEPRRQEAPRTETPRREHREPRETEAPKTKPGRIEVRIERL